MKKIVLLAAAAAGVSTATPVFAADTLALSGQIDRQCALKLNGQNASTINLRSSQHPLGSFNVTCNEPGGFRVSIASANSGALKNGNYTFPYQLISEAVSGETGVAFGQTSIVNPIVRTVSGFSIGHATSAGANYNIGLRTDLNGAPILPGGVSLADTLTFTIEGL